MTRLYPAYARDVLSFLDFAQLQKCLLVSRSVNATIVANPAAIAARRRLLHVQIEVDIEEVSQTVRINEDGYADVSSPWCNNSWVDKQAEWGCCREELEELAVMLVGERILPAHRDDRLVKFWVDSSATGGAGVSLYARNAMTAETAFDVLHLLEHLRHTYVERHSTMLLGGQIYDDCRLNPSIVQLLSDGAKPYRLHAVTFVPRFPPATVDKLVARLEHLKVRKLEWQKDGDFEAALDFAVQARRHCKSIKVYTESSAFDAVLQHFQYTTSRIGRNAVPELILSFVVDGDYWPAGLPQKSDMEPLGRDQCGVVRYRLRDAMTNANSGEKFNVVVECYPVPWEGNREKLIGGSLLFR